MRDPRRRERRARTRARLGAQDDRASAGDVFVAPGNGGTAAIAENVAIAADDIESLSRFVADKSVDLTVVGPEAPLVEGIVDRLNAEGKRCFGPPRAAARLEGSKVFSKEFMRRHRIPTADFEVFDDAVGGARVRAREGSADRRQGGRARRGKGRHRGEDGRRRGAGDRRDHGEESVRRRGRPRRDRGVSRGRGSVDPRGVRRRQGDASPVLSGPQTGVRRRQRTEHRRYGGVRSRRARGRRSPAHGPRRRRSSPRFAGWRRKATRSRGCCTRVS